jgi:hypothetical protein
MLSISGKWPGPEIFGLYALDITAIHSNIDIFRFAMLSGYDIPKLYFSAFWKRSYLHWTATYGQLKLVEFLLDAINNSETGLMEYLTHSDRYDETALQTVAVQRNIQVMKVFLSYTD